MACFLVTVRLVFAVVAQTVFMAKIRQKTPFYGLKILVTLSSLGGVILSLITAKRDGYSHWSRRLLYFTAQSNLWLGTTFLLILLLPLKRKNAEKWKRGLYLLKFVFTVSITVTGVVFCALLAPFADDGYRPWTLPNALTHVVSPALAVADLFTDKTALRTGKKQVFLCLLPPLIYCAFVGVLGAFSVDFGRGENYPYFFLNYRSPAGLFGFSDQRPFFVGAFYWLAVLCLFILAIALVYTLPFREKRPRKK